MMIMIRTGVITLNFSDGPNRFTFAGQLQKTTKNVNMIPVRLAGLLGDGW